MLIQFNFKNYKSFRDEVSLDLSATKITEHESHVVDIANDKLLKVAAIYGGESYDKQFKALAKRPQIIIGTPGRIIDQIGRAHV